MDTLFLLKQETKEKGEGRLKEAYAFLAEIQKTHGYWLARLFLQKQFALTGKLQQRTFSG